MDVGEYFSTIALSLVEFDSDHTGFLTNNFLLLDIDRDKHSTQRELQDKHPE